VHDILGARVDSSVLARQPFGDVICQGAVRALLLLGGLGASRGEFGGERLTEPVHDDRSTETIHIRSVALLKVRRLARQILDLLQRVGCPLPLQVLHWAPPWRTATANQP